MLLYLVVEFFVIELFFEVNNRCIRLIIFCEFILNIKGILILNYWFVKKIFWFFLYEFLMFFYGCII